MDTIGANTAHLEYGGVHISEAFQCIPVGMAMHIFTVECFEATFQSSPLLYAGKRGKAVASNMHTRAIINRAVVADNLA